MCLAIAPACPPPFPRVRENPMEREVVKPERFSHSYQISKIIPQQRVMSHNPAFIHEEIQTISIII